MVEGAIHHGTEMTVESNYVGTYGQECRCCACGYSRPR